MSGALLVALVRLVTGVVPRWVAPPPAAGPCIFFANHTSHLDAVVLWACLPPDWRARTRPVAARDYWEAGAARRYLAQKIFHALLIDRTKVTVQNNPVRQMSAALAGGHSLILFPEGTRGEGGEVAPFKSGLFHLANEVPEAPLIPVLIENLNRILPKGEFLPAPLLSSVTFGAPLAKTLDETKTAFLERAREAVSALKERD